MRSALTVLGVLAIAVPAMAAPFGVGYRETWNAYATGNADTTYRNVWSCSVMTAGTGGNASYSPTTDYPSIQTVNSISTPNSIGFAAKSRALVNSLVDGVTNGTVDGTELSAGQAIFPDQTAALNTAGTLDNVDNLQLRTFFTMGTNTNRAKVGVYSELSYGAIHAPALTGALDPLSTSIPLIALGKLNLSYDNTALTANGSNTSAYFFDGLKWNRLGNIAASGATTDLVAKIYYDGTSTYGWSAYIHWIGTAIGSGSIATTIPLQFDPTLVGFNTVSEILPNSGSNPTSVMPTYDDVWVAGGLVIPEPATAVLLGLGAMFLRRRR
jgi:hypothetical protein